ncbi:LamG domain-containing protein [Blastopirellula retiformator]|uniref:LamG-like jellyroll fold domain-containing protein n=1 Tax=Blastopirellula retiformator TaxID=2527970 RepID=A0A5C5V9W8_9BACT|nr:LamG domain-containing protein [Blastopirellula retiformator]TWT34687.1 hypothetical protein Enr8_21000 [Blastopirellula retiformator]
MALVLNGTSDYVTFGDVLDMFTEDRTIVAHVNPLISVAGSTRHVVAKWSDWSNGYIFGMASSGWRLNISGVYPPNANYAPPIGAWTQMAASIDRSLGTDAVRVYADGVEAARANCPTPNGNNLNGSVSFCVGAVPGLGGYWPGKIAHVQVYGRVLSPEEIVTLKTAPASIADGLIGYWPLVADAVSPLGGATGTLQRGATFDEDDPAPYSPGGGQGGDQAAGRRRLGLRGNLGIGMRT